MSAAEAIAALKSRLSDVVVEEQMSFGTPALEVKKEKLIPVLSFLKKESPCTRFEVLMDLTAVDTLAPLPRTKVIYFLHSPKDLARLRVSVTIAREESLPTVISLWEGADWYERELYDLFGVHFDGHRGLKRILMPDNWVGHPLRKDYPLTEEPVQFKGNVRPKVPSEIIQIRRGQQAYHE